MNNHTFTPYHNGVPFVGTTEEFTDAKRRMLIHFKCSCGKEHPKESLHKSNSSLPTGDLSMLSGFVTGMSIYNSLT